MTIGEILKSARGLWQNGSPDMIGVEALLCHFLSTGKEDLIKNVDQEVDNEKVAEFMAFVHRLHEGEPLSYLISNKEFYGLDFFVDKRVLTPRPETEQMVEIAANILKNEPLLRSVLDIGTGSGCIAVTLAKFFPRLEVMATDVSSLALEVARINAETHEVVSRIRFVESDLLEMVKARYDIVLANLPYIGTEKFNFVSKEAVTYEPHVALFGGKDGLFLYEKLFSQIMANDWKPKYLLGEFGFLQGERVRELLGEYFGEYDWRIFMDLASIERGFVVDFGKLK